MTATLEEPASYLIAAETGRRGSGAAAVARRIACTIPWPICAITVIAGVLRVIQLDAVSSTVLRRSRAEHDELSPQLLLRRL